MNLRYLDWKTHLALFPVYMLILTVLAAIVGIVFVGLYQFGPWGPVVGFVSVWFVAGLFYGLVRNT